MKLDLKLFLNTGLFDLDSDNFVSKLTYHGKFQLFTLFYRFKTWNYYNCNEFYVCGLNSYDRMQVDTFEKLREVAVLMGYDDEIISLIDNVSSIV